MGNIVVLPSKIKPKFPKRLPKFSKFSKTSKTSKTSEGGSSRKKDEPLKYYLANFEKDTDIMVIFHFLGCYLFQSAFSAPVEEKMATQGDYQVLDVGCGAGTWMLDLATIYKTPMFTGIDICTMFPAEIKPDNVVFMQGDILNGLPYDDNSFDYVHQGNMVCVFTTKEWDFILSELIRVCKPGGYIEFTEPELATNTGPILTRFYDALLDHSNSRNVKIRISNDIISSLESLESLSMIQNVEYKTTTVSLGYTKGGNAGQAYFEVHDGFFLNEPMPETLCTFMGLSKEEYLDLFDEAKNEVNTGIAPDCDLYRIWCQKV